MHVQKFGSPTGEAETGQQLSHRKNQDYQERVNTDLIICEDTDRSAGFAPCRTGLEVATLSTIIEPQSSDAAKRQDIMLGFPDSMPTQTSNRKLQGAATPAASTAMMVRKESQATAPGDYGEPRGYDSNLDYGNNVPLATNFMVGTHGSQSIMLVQQKNLAGKAVGGGVEAGGKSRGLSPQQRKKMEGYSRKSRNALEPIEPHFSASSTVKIDINSMNDDTKENSPRNVFKHKIIPPESQIGKVYQK